MVRRILPAVLLVVVTAPLSRAGDPVKYEARWWELHDPDARHAETIHE